MVRLYAKPPFGGPAHVLRHLGRYTHRMAISNRFRKELLPLAHKPLASDGHEQLPVPPSPSCDLWPCPRCGDAMKVVQRFNAAQLYLAALDSS